MSSSVLVPQRTVVGPPRDHVATRLPPRPDWEQPRRPEEPGWDPLAIDVDAQPTKQPPLQSALPPLVTLPRDVPPLPDPARWSGVLSRAVVEVLIGNRPAAQLRRWLAEDVWLVINRRAELRRKLHGQHSPPPVRILRVHSCALSTEDCESAIVVHDGRRVRAIAMRLQLFRGRWRATVVRIA